MERRFAGAELRAEGRRLIGPAIRYGDVSPSHRERFEPGALTFGDAPVFLDYEHDPHKVLAYTGAGLELRDGPDALMVEAELPALPLAERALEEVRAGTLRGLSIEFKAQEERRESGLRVVSRAQLFGVAVVRRPSYPASRVENRRRSGRTMRATIPADAAVECRCSGAACKFARITGEAMQDAFDRAFKQFEREVVAGFGSYDMPLASASAGTLRGRVLANGDGEVEIDLPEDSNGAATVAAHDAAGVIVRPHIDAADADSTVEGETRVYTRAPIRAFLVSATDARQGWPKPALVATSDDIEDATADAPRGRVARWR